MSTPRKVTAHGRTQTVTEWARETGIPVQTILKRLENGWDPERSVTQKNRTKDNRSKEHVAEYRTWKDIRRRCNSANRPDHGRYGGRGIVVCQRWMESFQNFLADMGKRPSPRHSIERDDNDGPYSPDNCRWATASEQQRNKRNNRMLTHEGRTMCLAAWAEAIGVKSSIIWSRIFSYKWTVARALTEPVLKVGKHPRK